jgi:hypothetical protein
VEATSVVEAQRILLKIRLEERHKELVEAKKVALRRSGARGKTARLAEIQSEQAVKDAEELCVGHLFSLSFSYHGKTD